MAALTRAFRAYTRRSGYCAIGSVKSNVGHLDAAAGVVGLIKAVLGLAHREIPATVNFQKPNTEIDFAATPFEVADSWRPWPSPDGPRLAAVNTLGVGGTNAHVILQEAPPAASSSMARPARLLPLSAPTAAGLDATTVSAGTACCCPAWRSGSVRSSTSTCRC